ncbi:hypothetical protein HKX48_003253, partial [Thoreauomyces humboldtii]
MSLVADDIECFRGSARAFFLSAPIFDQINTTVEQEVVAVAVAEEGGLHTTVEQEVVVVVAEKVEEVKEVKEVKATVEQQVVAVVVSATLHKLVAAKERRGCPEWWWY